MKNYRLMFLLLLVSTVLGSATSAAEKPSAEFLSQALLNQEQMSAPSLQAEYTIKGYRDSKEIGDESNVRYVRTPQIIFLEEKTGVDPKLFYRWSFNRILKEGRVATVRSLDGSMVSGQLLRDGLLPRLTIRSMVETSSLYTAISPLFTAVAKGSVGDETAMIDGHSCWKVTIPFQELAVPGDGEYVVWLDPDVGFCPRRLDNISRGPDADILSFSMTFDRYCEVRKGVFFPMRQMLTASNSLPSSVCEVKDVRVGQEVAQSDITIEFPPGVRVRDMRTGKVVK